MTSEAPNLALEALGKKQIQDAIITEHARLQALTPPSPPFCIYKINPAQKHDLFPTLKINSRPDQWYPWNSDARNSPCRDHILQELTDHSFQNFGHSGDSTTSRKPSSPQTSAQEHGWFYQEYPGYVQSLIDEDFCAFHRRTSEEIRNRASQLAQDREMKKFDQLNSTGIAPVSK